MNNTTTLLNNELNKLTLKRTALLKEAIQSKDFNRFDVQKAFHDTFEKSYYERLVDVFNTAYVLTKLFNRNGSRLIMPNGMIVRPNKLNVKFNGSQNVTYFNNDEILHHLDLGQCKPTITFEKPKMQRKTVRFERNHLHSTNLKMILERFTNSEIEFIRDNLGNTIENSYEYRESIRCKNFGWKSNYQEPERTQLSLDIQDTNDKIEKLKKIIEKHRKFLIQNKWVSKIEESINDLEANIDEIYSASY